MPQRYSEQQLEQLWTKAGGDPKVAPLMAKLALRESGGKAHINNAGLNKNGSVDYGLWQINSVHGYDPNKLYDPLYNAKAAVAVYKAQGPKAWATYNSAIDKKYLSGFSNAKRSTSVSPTVTSTGPDRTAPDRTALALSLLGMGGGYDSDPTTSLLSGISSSYGVDPLQLAITAALQKHSTTSPSREITASAPSTQGSGHADLKSLAKLGKDRFGLTIREFEPYDKVDPVHVKGSYHYSGRAFDASGSPQQMAAFDRFLAKKYGKRLKELFYDPGKNLKNGRPTTPIGGHGDHVHVAE